MGRGKRRPTKIEPIVHISYQLPTSLTNQKFICKFYQIFETTNFQPISMASPTPTPTQTTPTSAKPKKQPRIPKEIAQQHLIKIPNQIGNRSLFYVLHVALQHQIRGFSEKQFKTYRKGQHRLYYFLHNDIVNLMRKVGAPLNETSYDPAEWVPQVIDYWNNVLHRGKHQIKVFLFGPLGDNNTPIKEYGPTNYNINILIYFDGQRYEGVYTTTCFYRQTLVPFLRLLASGNVSKEDETGTTTTQQP